MTRRVAAAACAVALSFSTSSFNTSAFAHHPGGVGNAGGAGPIITIPAATLEQGHAAMAVWYDYVQLGGLGNAQLLDAASKHIHAHSLSTIESLVASYAYGVTNDLMVAFRLPFNRRTDIRSAHHSHGLDGNTIEYQGDSTGFGDVTALGQWRFLNNTLSGTQAALLFGVKVPTGSTNVFNNQGEPFETEFQPGSGSWDWLVGGALSQRFGRWSFDANLLYIFAGNGAQQTNLGDRFLYNAGVSYRLFGTVNDPANAMAHAGHSHSRLPTKAPAPVVAPTPQWALDAILEVNGEWHDYQTVAGEVDPNSGGNTVYVSPGFRVSYDRFSAFTLVGIPVVNNLNGLQSNPEYKVITGVAFSF